MQRFNLWARRHPWIFAPVLAIVLFAATMALGTLILDQTAGGALPYALTYSVVFSVLTTAINSIRNRRRN